MSAISKIFSRYILFFLTAMAYFAHAAPDGKPIGYVMTVKGESFIKVGDKEIPAAVGTPVVVGSALSTGPNSSLGVTFKDNTIMSFGPNTELTVDEYLFEPAAGELKLSARLEKGTLNFISGVIAKLKPEAVALQTPTGTIGVRGTHFMVKVAD